jgi:chloramphenicol O-acetyltransferase type B
MINFLISFQRVARKLIRLKYYSFLVRRKAASCGKIVRANYKTIVNERTVIDNNFNSNGLVVVGRGGVRFGQNFHCGFGCVVITENHNYQGRALPYDESYCVGDVKIGENVWFGINVVVLPGVEIGEGAIIQAGAVVVKDIPACGIAGGNPAVVFSERDGEHYQALKLAGRFH